MIRKGVTIVGCFFISIAAFLYAVKHITAAIMTAYINTPDVNFFDGGYQSIGFGITFWIFASFLLGMILLIRGMWPAFQNMIPHKSAKIKI